MAVNRGSGRGRGEGYLPLREAMERLFEGSVITPQLFPGQSSYPPVDVYLTDEEIVVEMAVPGASADDINISVTGDTVTISGDVTHSHGAQKGQAYLEEIPRGKFQRSFALPIQISAERAEAGFNNGILELRLPKSEATRPRKIQVKHQQPTIHSGSGGTVERETVTPKPTKSSK